jgi:CheY-like chemotaxis protein
MDRTPRSSAAGLLHALAVGGALAVALVPAGSLLAAAPVVQDADRTRMVDDFLHYVLIAKPDLAEAAGRKLFDSGVTDAELADIVREGQLEGKVERALSRGRGMADVGPMVMRFETSLEQGRMDLARDQDRIREAIEMLDGPLRGQLMARNRLVEAGEYAVPQLLQTLIVTRDPQTEIRVTEILGEIKRQAVLPLCSALPELSPDVQSKVCRILAGIGWPTAIPYLLDLATARDTSPEVRDAAMNAFRRLGGTSTDVSAAFTALARKFFDGEQSLVAYPGDPTNMVWTYGVHSGLAPVPVPTSVFGPVMAMRCARIALESDPSNRMALATYIAADLRRENQLGTDETDPFAVDAEYSPQFFATAAGSSICRDVLSMAIDATDTALVRDAIAAIGDTVGRRRLFEGGGRAPLLECLRYPDRRVRYDAALVLGNAMPASSFPGDIQVVPLLASAVRSGADSYAAVVAPTEEDRNQIASRLQDAGFRVIAAGSDFYELEPELNASNGVDLIVVQAEVADSVDTVSRIRELQITGATPVMLMTDSVGSISLAREFAEDRATTAFAGGSDDQFEATLDRLLNAASGGRLTDADAAIYTRDALQTLAVIARSESGVYDIAAAEPALLEAMDTFSGGMRLLVAEVVSLIGSDAAQQGLIDAAFSAKGSEQVAMLDAAASNARLFGNRTAARQVEALRRLIGQNTAAGGDQAVADAAGRLYGSLDLSSDEAVRLITE